MGTVTKAPLLLAGSALAAGAVVYLAVRRASASEKRAQDTKPAIGLVPLPLPEPKPKIEPVDGFLGPLPPPDDGSSRPIPTVEQVRQMVDVVRNDGSMAKDWDQATRLVIRGAATWAQTRSVPDEVLDGDPSKWPSWVKNVRNQIKQYAIDSTREHSEDLASDWRKFWQKEWKGGRTGYGVLIDLLKRKERKEAWWPYVGHGANASSVATYIAKWSEVYVWSGPPLLWLNAGFIKKCSNVKMEVSYEVQMKARRALFCAIEEKILPLMGVTTSHGEFGQLTTYNPAQKWRSRDYLISEKSWDDLRGWFRYPFTKKRWSSVTGSIKDNWGPRARIYDAFTHFWPMALAKLATMEKYGGIS